MFYDNFISSRSGLCERQFQTLEHAKSCHKKNLAEASTVTGKIKTTVCKLIISGYNEPTEKMFPSQIYKRDFVSSKI